MLRRVLLSVVVALATTLLSATVASANNRFSLDATPASPGNVVQDASGTAYVAWAHSAGGENPDVAMFCKIPRGGTCTSPISLPIPLTYGETSLSGVDGVSGAFPVFGSGGLVYVVVPRYVQNDVILYASNDGGQTFVHAVYPSSVTAGAGPYSNKTGPTNVILSGGDFVIAANNAGLGFSEVGSSQGNFSFASPGAGGVAGSTMGLDTSGNPVVAYSNLGSPPTPLLFYRYDGSGPKTDQTNWVGPTAIANGDEPRLAGGASGLLLAADDYSTAGPDPRVLTVRKYNGTSFDAPVSLGDDPATQLFAAGTIGQSPSGRVAVAWPTSRGGDNTRVMRLYVSTNGGASFAATGDIARIGDAYGLGDNAQIAAADDGQGWLTFRDAGGLELADFSPIAPYVAPGGGGGGGSTIPPAYSGAYHTASKSVGSGLSVTLKLPKSCLQARQAFKLYVGTRIKRKLAHGQRLAVTKIVFSINGAKVKTITKRPFTLLVPGLLGASHTTHTIAAKVTVRVRREHHKTRNVAKTINGAITIC
jgi:hypothetical protein